jgi:hypothetical protein
MSAEESVPLLSGAQERPTEAPQVEDFSDLDPEILRASTEDIITRTRLLDNDIRVNR